MFINLNECYKQLSLTSYAKYAHVDDNCLCGAAFTVTDTHIHKAHIKPAFHSTAAFDIHNSTMLYYDYKLSLIMLLMDSHPWNAPLPVFNCDVTSLNIVL